jgi:phospholysine phosphohistidine inorganic pyrophosphate phosphatase
VSLPAAFLLDLDGTLYTDAGPVPGGPQALSALRERGIPFRAVTNTTSRSRAGLGRRLAGLGYDLSPGEIITPVLAAQGLCRRRGHTRVVAYVPEAAWEDLAGLETRRGGTGGPLPDAVIVGDLGEAWSFALLQEAFGYLLAGSELVALSRDRYFLKQGALTLDAGPFVAALEFASGRTAAVVGKPSADFYAAALASLGHGADAVAMVGDDLWSDIEGAQRAGITAWLVRTGKFGEQTLKESGIRPDRILASVAELAALAP